MKKNLIVKILIGIPASGKSTWSKEFVRKNPSWVRINRDDYRFMLRNEPVCEPKIEDMITGLFYNAVDAALSKKLNVIVDNTNLKARYIDEMVEFVQYRADVEFMVFSVSLEEAIERDKKREKMVGEGVITKMYKDYKNLVDGFSYSNQTKKTFIYKEPVFEKGLESIVIFDIDGTLSHVNGKRDYFDWNRVDRDDLDLIVFDAYRVYRDAGYKIFVVTGRSEEAREKTELWLSVYGITYEKLLMRKAEDFRPDNTVKMEIFNHYIKGKYNVQVIFDDRQKVVDMWRDLGLKVFQVAKSD
jgi:predicted kinase